LMINDFIWILVATLGLQLTSNIAQGAHQGYIPDLVPSVRRGAAAGAKSIAEMSGYLLAAFIITIQLGRGEWLQAFVGGGIVLLVGLTLTWLGVNEPSTVIPASSESLSDKTGWRELVTLNRQRDAAFIWWIISRLLMSAGVSVLTTYTFLYAKTFIHASDP